MTLHAFRSVFQTIALFLLLATGAEAAALKPYQQTALERILADMPADQRDMIRPQLEMTLANLTEPQVAMMLSAYAANQATSEKENDNAEVSEAGDEWGAAEADFERAFAGTRAYIARVSDRHDAMRARWDSVLRRIEEDWRVKQEYGFAENTASEACNRELLGVPFGRKKAAQMQGVLTEQDRLQVRLMIEMRAEYGSVADYARALGQPENSGLVQAVRHYFATPASEALVMQTLQSLEDDIAALIETSSRERHAIDSRSYPDSGPGVESALHQRDLDGLVDRTTQAATARCAAGQELYVRGIIRTVEPVIPAVKRHIAR